MTKNVLFITADQWRGECLSCLGHLVQTPNLDALAREGTLFARHFANASPCGPSRASIHTGLYQHKHGVAFNGTPLAARHTNWALEVRKTGVEPVLFGYTDTTLDPRLDHDPETEGILPGLTPIVQLGKSVWNPAAWVDWLTAKGYPIPASRAELYTKTKDQPEWEDGGKEAAPLDVPAELHDTWFMADQVLDYIEGRSGWCVHLSLLRPHPPWIAPEPYNRLYPPGELPPFKRAADPADEAAQHPYLEHLMGLGYMQTSRNAPLVQRMRSSYFGLMTEVDHNLGRLFAALKRSGAWGDTLIVFTSDHGEQMGDHWLMGKTAYFDQSFAVPLIVFNPDAEADPHRGKHIDAFTESVDLMPTLLDWFDIDSPTSCDGASLLPATRTGQLGDDWRTEAHWEYDFGFRSFGARKALDLSPRQCKLTVIRDANSKYVHFAGLPPVFFDLANDPEETTNLAGDPRYRRQVQEAAGKLLSWRMAHEVQPPTTTTPA